MTFVDKVKELKEDGSVSEDVINAAIDYCISHGILVSFFRENRKEIIHTMIIDETYENRLRHAAVIAEQKKEPDSDE